jgi:hypothetical protein
LEEAPEALMTANPPPVGGLGSRLQKGAHGGTMGKAIPRARLEEKMRCAHRCSRFERARMPIASPVQGRRRTGAVACLVVQALGAVLCSTRVVFAAAPFQKLVPSDFVAGEFIEFGASLAVEGETLVVGDPSATFQGAETGEVYVFERHRGTWVETAKLGPPSVSRSIDFGREIALHGDRLVVGAAYADAGAPSAGAVYVFERGAGRWAAPAILTASVPVAGELLGARVALSGDTIAASTLSQGFPASRDSRVYVFDRDLRSTRWRQSGVLVDPGGGDPFAFPHSFGVGVTFSGAELAVAASFGLQDPRVIHLRKRAATGSWRKSGKLFTPEAGAVGRASDRPVWLAATADRLVAGAPADFGGQGAAYVFDRGPSGFAASATLTAALDPRPGAAPSFVLAVAVSGERVLAGATEDEQGWGSAFLFEREGSRWKQRAKLSPKDPSPPHGQFGQAVAMDDDAVGVAVGATDLRWRRVRLPHRRPAPLSRPRQG